mgnify:CR=1 FL=1
MNCPDCNVEFIEETVTSGMVVILYCPKCGMRVPIKQIERIKKTN